MTICSACGNYVPDLGGHNCPGRTGAGSPFVYIPPVITTYPQGQKCALCGSTAIDHKEAECLRARQLKPVEEAK